MICSLNGYSPHMHKDMHGLCVLLPIETLAADILVEKFLAAKTMVLIHGVFMQYDVVA